MPEESKFKETDHNPFYVGLLRGIARDIGWDKMSILIAGLAEIDKTRKSSKDE